MVGSGYAATDVNNVVGGKDDKFDVTGAKEDIIDAVEEVLGVDPHARGNTAVDVEVSNGDTDDIFNQKDLSKDEFRTDDAYASIQSMMKENPVWNFSSRCASK